MNRRLHRSLAAWPVAAGVLALALPAMAAPGYGPPLSITTGTVYTVDTVTELQNAVSSINSAGGPATILIRDGTYVLNALLHMMCNRVRSKR